MKIFSLIQTCTSVMYIRHILMKHLKIFLNCAGFQFGQSITALCIRINLMLKKNSCAIPKSLTFNIYMTGLTFNTSVTQLVKSFFPFVPESQSMYSTSMNTPSKTCHTYYCIFILCVQIRGQYN